MKHWLNVDKPTRKLTIHTNDCMYVRQWLKADTRKNEASGLDSLHADGGWVACASRQDATAAAERTLARWKAEGRDLTKAKGIRTCPRCIG